MLDIKKSRDMSDLASWMSPKEPVSGYKGNTDLHVITPSSDKIEIIGVG